MPVYLRTWYLAMLLNALSVGTVNYGRRCDGGIGEDASVENSLEEAIVSVFRHRGASCLTTFGDPGCFGYDSVPAMSFSLDGNLQRRVSAWTRKSGGASAMDLCPFAIVRAAGLNSTAESALLDALEEAELPQKVHALILLQQLRNTSSHGFFASNINSVVAIPEGDSLLLFKPRLHPRPSLEPIATWGGMTPIKFSLEHDLFRPERLNLHGGVLTASAVEYPPFYIPGEEGEARGIEVELVRAVASSLGGSVAVGPPTDGGIWGDDFDGDGVFSGMVGDLQAGRVDLGFSQLFVKEERRGFMDFTLEYDYEYACFLVKKYPPLPQVNIKKKNNNLSLYDLAKYAPLCCFIFKVLAFVLPFDPLTWALILLTLAASSLFTWTSGRLDKRHIGKFSNFR